MATRVTLDSQGRLILRENGKIILPFEHFANAVMLKHMNGPHGLHLGIEATVRAVSNSFTCHFYNKEVKKIYMMIIRVELLRAASAGFRVMIDEALILSEMFI